MLRQAFVNGKWREGLPTEQGQQFRYLTPAGWVYGFHVVAAAPESMKITNLAFENRFTRDERKAIRRAASTDEDVQDFMSLAAKATHIDLSLQQTIESVHALEQMGLIGEGRAAEILSPPVDEDERWNGA